MKQKISSSAVDTNKVREPDVSALYSVPGTYVLFIGPAECARHNCRMHFRYGSISFLCPDDREIAMGKTESIILETIPELQKQCRRQGRDLSRLLLFTGCLTEFMNVDFRWVTEEIRRRYGIRAAHYQDSRFQRFDHSRRKKRNLYECLMDLTDPSETALRHQLQEKQKQSEERHREMMEHIRKMERARAEGLPLTEPSGRPSRPRDMHMMERVTDVPDGIMQCSTCFMDDNHDGTDIEKDTDTKHRQE
jgi:hypothetical protein